MRAADVSIVDLVASLSLVAVAVVLSRWRGLALEGSIAWATLRAAVQLLAVGAVLEAIIGPGRPMVWSWLWVAGMALVAGDVVRRRVPDAPGIFLLAVAAFAVTAGVTLTALFGLGIFPLGSTTVVPLAGLMVGNTMQATVLAARRVLEEVAYRRPEVEARLALGQSGDEAARPYVRRALRSALTPQIESTKAVGLIALPGAMTGLILAGVDPIDAVIVQAVVMFLVLAAAAIASTVVGLGTARRLFTRDHRLVRLERPAA